MARQFWRIDAADTEDDYQHLFVNGMAQHPLGLPGVACGICNQKWGWGRILPVTCPVGLRETKELQDGWPIPHERHRALREQVLAALREEGHDFEELSPGDDFQPAYVSLASRPRYDFIWATLGSVIVRDRVKELFEQHNVTGVVFCPAVITAVGKHEPTDPVPMSSTGEPEDVVEEVEKEEEPERFGPLYEMVVTSESGPLPAMENAERCPGCGLKQYDKTRLELILTERMLPDTDVFFLGETRWMIIGQKIHDLIQSNGLTNVQFEQIAVVPDPRG